MSCAAHDGIQRIAECAFVPAATQLAIARHMPNGRFDGAAAPNHGFESACRTTSLSQAPGLHRLDWAAPSLIDIPDLCLDCLVCAGQHRARSSLGEQAQKSANRF